MSILDMNDFIGTIEDDDKISLESESSADEDEVRY